jgi:enoyl-CoA hydratase/carnithine racemase
MSDIRQADLVLAEQRGGVLLLTLNRPDRLNAWTPALEDAYFARLDDAESDPAVRAIVLTGAGRGFCAGADMKDLSEVSAGTQRLERPRPRYFPATVHKPLIAAINGATAGLGLIEALYCDVRFCTPDAKLTTAFARRGLIAEYGLAWMLPRLIGQSRALDLLLSARVVLGDEALELGLVDRLAAPERLVDVTVAYAQDIADNCSPTALAIIKGQVRRALEEGFVQSAEEAERLTNEAVERPDFAEGIASYLERRPPSFAPLEPPARPADGV